MGDFFIPDLIKKPLLKNIYRNLEKCWKWLTEMWNLEMLSNDITFDLFFHEGVSH